MKYAVIVVGYNRQKPMKRLLDSLCNAVYYNPCDLIISLDYSKSQSDLLNIAKEVKWKHGEKKIRAFQTNQGLRPHILQCGDLTEEYDAVIVLEDDLIVAKGFFQYVTETVEFYGDNPKIAGISLYAYRSNQGNGRPFEAQFNGYDVFLMQFAQSWGQCWTKQMWQAFRSWYKEQTNISADGIIPDYVIRWDDRSWLKYYIRYTAEKGLYFVYPYFSLTTNNSECGEHHSKTNNAYQVPLSEGNIHNYRLPSIENAVKYDPFFERIYGDKVNQKYGGKVCLDLYGLKRFYGDANILISTNLLNYKIISKIGLNYRPHELNCMLPEKGNDIFVYDLREKEKNTSKSNQLQIVTYDVRAEWPRMTFMHGICGLWHGLKNKMHKKLHK